MNLLCSDWKLIKTASNRLPPTGSHWQHADRQITAPRSEGGDTEHSLHPSDALPTTPHVIDYSNLRLIIGVLLSQSCLQHQLTDSDGYEMFFN